MTFITGISGSFGSSFAEHLLHDDLADRVVGYSRDEVKQSELAAKLLPQYPDRFRLRLGDVRDFERLCEAMDGADTVIHAAALKIIRQGIVNPGEMFRTNVIGTENVLRAALKCRVRKVLVLSTDKSAGAVNFYGHTKGMAEALAVAFNTYSYPHGMIVAATRWGNVLGSRMSVVHIFRKAAQRGRPLPITDSQMTRFWITQSQTGRFVVDCLIRMEGGEVFVPKLPSMKIIDLGAAALGKEWLVPEDYEIVGIRPGEKIHEAMIAPEEVPRTIDCGDYFLITPPEAPWRKDWPWAGQSLPEGFSYTSDRNADWLTIASMRRLLERIP